MVCHSDVLNACSCHRYGGALMSRIGYAVLRQPGDLGISGEKRGPAALCAQPFGWLTLVKVPLSISLAALRRATRKGGSLRQASVHPNEGGRKARPYGGPVTNIATQERRAQRHGPTKAPIGVETHKRPAQGP